MRAGRYSANAAACTALATQQHPVLDRTGDDGDADERRRHDQHEDRHQQHRALGEPVGGDPAPGRGRAASTIPNASITPPSPVLLPVRSLASQPRPTGLAHHPEDHERRAVEQPPVPGRLHDRRHGVTVGRRRDRSRRLDAMQYVKLGSTGLDVSRDLPGLHELRRPRAGAATRGRSTRRRAGRSSSRRSRPASTSSTPPTSTPTAPARRSSAGRWRDFADRDEVVLATKVHGRMRPGPERRRACRARRS